MTNLLKDFLISKYKNDIPEEYQKLQTEFEKFVKLNLNKKGSAADRLIQNSSTLIENINEQKKLIEQFILESREAIPEGKRNVPALNDKANLSKIVSNITDLISILDEKGIIKYVSPSVTLLLGYDQEEKLGTNTLDLVHPDDLQRTQRYYQIAMVKSDNVIRFELRLRDITGKYKYFEASAKNMLKDPEVQGVIFTCRDITLHKELEENLRAAKSEAERSTKATSQFLASMSHEIRTPLNGVIGMTGLLQETQLTKLQEDYVETIRISGDTLLTVINDILDFSKIESGKLNIEQIPFELRMCIEDVFDLLASKAAEKSIDLLYHVDEETPSFIMGDITRLRQILMNLLSNAIKFTNKGEVFVEVLLLEEGLRSNKLQFKVKDTGIGIPEDKLEKLFSPFTQADASTTRKFGGTGLGLAISKRLVEAMGGRIWAESKPGKGAEFFFTITTAKSKFNRVMSLGEKIEKLSDKKALIIDDNETNRKILREQTRGWGMEPLPVESAKAALDLLDKKENYDLIILDMFMPEMDGLEFARIIRNDKKISTPIILLSSVGKQIEDKNDVELFNAIIAKPIKQSHLLDSVVSLLTEGGTTVRQQIRKKKLDEELAEKLPLKILIAEDNSINQKIAVNIFAQMGYKVDVAANGIEALDALKVKEYDLIFMDVQMPEMDGLEATRAIRSRYDDPKKPVIIAITASVLEEDKNAAFEAGMNDFVRKPILIEEIQAAVKKFGGMLGASQQQGSAPVEDKKEHELIDESVIDRLKELDSDENETPFYVEMINMFILQSDPLYEKIKGLMEKSDFEELQSAAHELKGMSANVGGEQLANLLQKIEDSAKSKSVEELEKLKDELAESFQVTIAAFNKYISMNHSSKN